MGEPPDRLSPTAPTNSAVEIVRQVSMIQSKYWRCMFPKGMPSAVPYYSEVMNNDLLTVLDPVNGVVSGERLHGSKFHSLGVGDG